MKHLIVLSFVVLKLLVSASAFPHSNGHVYTLRYNSSTHEFVLSNDTALEVAVTAVYNESLMSTGWDYLYFEANTSLAFTEDVLYYATGYLEGLLTAEKIYLHYSNVKQYTAQARSDPAVAKWVRDHRAFMLSYAKKHRFTSAFGGQLYKLLSQLAGLEKGYKEAAPRGVTVNTDDIFDINFHEEWGDVLEAFADQLDLETGKMFPNLDARGAPRHCSALIRLVPDDVYFSHVTWTHYETMMRQYKSYNFGPTQRISMSSYPGMVHSMDDWYMTGHKLAVMETTNGVYNAELFKEYISTNSSVVSEFLRVMIANYVAEDPESWVHTFSTLNSGTYNNQFMCFDMKRFAPGKSLPAGTFWIAEQLPGSVTTADVTNVINKQQYWASYNVPYFPHVFNISGNLEQEEMFGSFFSYTKYSRARIFARNATTVASLDDMKRMMRFNHYEYDPFSLIPNCSGTPHGVCDPTHSAMLTIASRGDLNPTVGEYGVLAHYVKQRDHGATDAKIATYKNMMHHGDGEAMKGVVISGPTYDDQPVFDWRTSPWAHDPNIVRRGIPDRYDFPWMEFETHFAAGGNSNSSTNTPLPNKSKTHDEDKGKKVAIIVGCVGGSLAAVAVIVILLRAKQRRKADDDTLLAE